MKPEKDLSTLASQVTELEEKLSFQQRTLEELNEVVLAQQTEIERLGRELSNYRKLTEELLERNPGEDLPHEKPPHY
ncbi:MAG: hypothetical protein CMJ72_03035 [Planctomycetaceae bacterium]|nr:hypothetical protein [Planctomycetaceae bacterium]